MNRYISLRKYSNKNLTDRQEFENFEIRFHIAIAWPEISPIQTPIVFAHGLKNPRQKFAKLGPPRILVIAVEAFFDY